jgi:hypothetical protein
MVLLVKPIKTGDDVTALGELTPQDTAEIVGPLVVQSDSEFNSTGGIKLPTGTTAERPATPKVGSTRFNTELGFAETWNGSAWLQGSGPAGSNGADGADGKSAYEIAVANGFVGTEAEWLDSLQGEDGPTVVSADADNIAILGTDGFIYVPKGSGGGGAAEVPVGTTAERPNPPITGNLRFNTTLDRLEVFGNSFWQILKYDRESTAPNIGTATATSNTTATVSFTPSANESIEAVSSYSGISDPDGIVATKAGTGAGTLNFVGLTQDRQYTFSVCAVNPVGNGTYSAPSNQIRTWSVPDAPIIGTATPVPNSTDVNVTFTAPAYDGQQPITSYTATSIPAGYSATINQAGSGTILVKDMADFTTYTFVVYATNSLGNSLPSAESNQASTTIREYPVNLLLVGGGGGSATQSVGAGAGAGGRVEQFSGIVLKHRTVYSIAIGAGGGVEAAGGATSFSGDGISTMSCVGGGAGVGNTGGTSGNGFGSGVIGAYSWGGGGGGGASASGGQSSNGSRGGSNGGAGLPNSLTGSAITYGGGGGGSYYGTNGEYGSSNGYGGAGGGGNGGNSNTGNSPATGGAGGANTGGGAGGRISTGGSGVVVASIPTEFYSGTYTGTLTTAPFTSGSNTILIFATSGTYTG